jgi:hypothetical protein
MITTAEMCWCFLIMFGRASDVTPARSMSDCIDNILVSAFPRFAVLFPITSGVSQPVSQFHSAAWHAWLRMPFEQHVSVQ